LITFEEFVSQIRLSEKNRNLYTSSTSLNANVVRGKSMKDLSLAIKIDELEEIEEKFIIKRW